MINSMIATAAVLALDVALWLVLRSRVSRLRALSVAERLLFAVMAVFGAGVLALIAFGALGFAGIPAALAGVLLGVEIAMLIQLRSLWANDVWNRVLDRSATKRR